MKRKSKESFTKRILLGYFGLRDLGKFEEYQRKLDYVASGFEVRLTTSISCCKCLTDKTDNQCDPNNVNINGALLEIIRNRAQHSIEDEDSKPSEEPAEPVRKEKGDDDHKATTERSRLRNRKAKVNLLKKFKLF